MRDEVTRQAAAERQARHRAKVKQADKDLKFLLEFIGRRHLEDLDAAVLELADTTDRDYNTVLDIQRVTSRQHKGRGPNTQQLVSDLADTIRKHDERGAQRE